MKSFVIHLTQRLNYKTSNQTGTIFRSRLFWCILLFKILASSLFAGPVFTQLFIPFLETFSAEPFSNPYEQFWSAGLDTNFPYPAVMLWIVSMPQVLLSWIGIHELPNYAELLLYRFPLIIADLTILIVLCSWLRRKVNLLLWLYWASPVLFYITYLHGQLDVVAMALVFVSSHLLFSNRWLASSIVLALAIATKIHISLIVPFVLIYLWQYSRSMSLVGIYFLTVTTLFVLVNLPYISSSGFHHIVLLNAQYEKIGVPAFYTQTEDIKFLIVPAIILLLTFYGTAIQIKNRDLFLFFMGSSFCVLLLFIPTSPGWYYWILPFLIYFYARLAAGLLFLLIMLQVAYLLYFASVPTSDFGTFWFGSTHNATIGNLYMWFKSNGLNPNSVVNFTFTTLQTMLLINTAVMLYRGVHIQQNNKYRARPFMIGIAGDSGSGKTTVASNIGALLGEQRVGKICGDDMHRWERGNPQWTELTHLNPLANELHAELDFVKRLRRNQSIYRRQYDHDTGRFTKEFEIKPRSVLILEGLHTLYLKPARDLFDFKIFLKLDPTLLLHRKVLRDTEKRGATKEKVLDTIRARKSDAGKYIEVQEQHADLLISTLPYTEITQDDIGDPNLVIQERLKITLSNAYYATPLIFDLMRFMPNKVRHYYDEQDRQVIEIDQPPELDLIRSIGEENIPGLEAFGINEPNWNQDWLGFIQLIVVFCIFNDWEGQS